MNSVGVPETHGSVSAICFIRQHSETVNSLIYLFLAVIAVMGALFAPDFLKSRNLFNVLLSRSPWASWGLGIHSSSLVAA